MSRPHPSTCQHVHTLAHQIHSPPLKANPLYSYHNITHPWLEVSKCPRDSATPAGLPCLSSSFRIACLWGNLFCSCFSAILLLCVVPSLGHSCRQSSPCPNEYTVSVLRHKMSIQQTQQPIQVATRTQPSLKHLDSKLEDLNKVVVVVLGRAGFHFWGAGGGR